MAILQTPSIRTVISGDGVTSLDRTTSIAVTEKLEAVRYIKSTDLEVPVDYSYIDVVKSMYFYSNDTYTLTFNTSTDSIVFEVTGEFKIDPTVAFRTSITSLTIATKSTTDIEIDIRIYGVTA